MSEEPFALTAQPLPKRSRRPRKKRTKKVRISFMCDEDMAGAIRRLARHCKRPVANAVCSIIRSHLVDHPACIYFGGFPPEQSLELWVWANQQVWKEGGPKVNPNEALARSRDGSRVVRLDYLTAA